MIRTSAQPKDHFEGRWKKGKKYTLYAIVVNNGTKFRSVTPKEKDEPYVIYNSETETFSANAGWEIVEMSEDSRLSAMGGNGGGSATPGEPGKDAGFGTISASVANTSGTPSVVVETSGPDTAKNINFKFFGLKGSEGKKGDQGNTGSSVEYPYELVNNRRTNDATKGLSAAEGKRIGDDISRLGLLEYMEGYYTEWDNVVSFNPGNYESTRFGVSPGEKVYIEQGGGGDGVRLWLFVDDSMNLISKSEAYANAPAELTVPNGATQCIVQCTNGMKLIVKNGHTLQVSELTEDVSELTEDVSELTEDVSELKHGQEELGLLQYESGYYTEWDNVVSFNPGNYESTRFGVSPGEKVYIEQGGGGDGVRLWLFVDDSMNLISKSEAYANAPAELTVPDGATQCIVQCTNGMKLIVKYSVSEEIREIKGIIKDLDSKVFCEMNGGSYVDEITEFVDKNKYLFQNGTLDSLSYNVTQFIVIKDATRIVLSGVWAATSELLAYALYDANKSVIARNPIPQESGAKDYILQGQDIPEGAVYLRATELVISPASIRIEYNANGVKNDIEDLRLDDTSQRLSLSPSLSLPIPKLAFVNIVSTALPTTKTDDINAVLEFDDRAGNIFRKNIVINAQGNSTLGHSKKNFSISFDNSSLKFGDWVSQDGFHLKAYMLDTTRVKSLVAYDFYESILLSRGIRTDRAWKRLQLPAIIPATSESVTGTYLQLDDGAKGHPSGFPIILFHNGEFYGIYCWQLKKDRKNYHQKKDEAGHIHLDGNISNVMLWSTNGVIDWQKWSGEVQESPTSPNTDGIEIRNPKKLILVDGTKYDGDDNRGELIDENSPGYDPSNEDMVRTAAVKQSIISLSSRVYALTQMSAGPEKKEAVASVFDVESLIDYIIFGQVTGNIDGYQKNWQWTTYDGRKWAVNAYDLDATMGWAGTEYYEPARTFIASGSIPVSLVLECFLPEIKARYAYLRHSGVISTDRIVTRLNDYMKAIGVDYYDLEFAKWPIGNTDNLWRFEVWTQESIAYTDTLMDYQS